MSISKTLLSEFVKMTNDEPQKTKSLTYGTIVTDGSKQYVKIDGSDILTPFTTTTDIKANERVIVTIDNHIATVTNNITNPSAGNDRVTSAEGSIGRFDHLFAGNITADNIAAGAITTEKLYAGSITADKIAAGSITAGSGIIANGAIGSAQISSIDAGKISTGTIDTSNVTVAGANGVLRMKNNRLQVFDGMSIDQVERVSLGDVNGDGSLYGLRVRGKDGNTVLFDENGVTGEGITDGSITNDKINPDAGIDGGKLNISSVINKINEDGSTSINGVKIDIDGESLNSKVYGIELKQTQHSETITQQQAEINKNKESIQLKVSEQKYSEDMALMNTSLTKHDSEIKVLKEGVSLSATKTEVTNQVNATLDESKKYTNKSITEYGATVDVKFDNITLRVGKTETGLGEVDNKYTEIKQTVDNIDITGKVNFSDLSTPNSHTTINGANIKTGTIDTNAVNIKGGTTKKIVIANDNYSVYDGSETDVNRKVFLGFRTNSAQNVPSIMLGYNGINPATDGAVTSGGTYATYSHYPNVNNPESVNMSYSALAFKYNSHYSQFSTMNMYQDGDIDIKAGKNINIRPNLRGRNEPTVIIGDTMLSVKTPIHSYGSIRTDSVLNVTDNVSLSSSGVWVGGSGSVSAEMIYANTFAFRNAFSAFKKNDYNNNIMNYTNWDWQGYNLVNVRLYQALSSYAMSSGYNVDVQNDVDVLIANEPISDVTPDGMVEYDMGEMIKLLYSKITSLEKEIQELKSK